MTRIKKEIQNKNLSELKQISPTQQAVSEKEVKRDLVAMKTGKTPLKFNLKEGENALDVTVTTDNMGDPEQIMEETLSKLVGVKDGELARQIFDSGVRALKPFYSEAKSSNIIAQTLHDQQPKDAIEARLTVQSSALYMHGMSNLRRAENAEILMHSEHYMNKAIKLIRLHNETIEALTRYRRGGEQKVTVTHSVLANQAVVNNFTGGGDFSKNKGDSPC